MGPSDLVVDGAVEVSDREKALHRISRLTHAISARVLTDWPDEGRLGEVCHYALEAPGKLIRPVLLLESAAMVGGDPATVISAAAGCEGAHVASLVHDDIIDGDLLRRGRRATHVEFGRDRAIVGGDALIFYLFDALGRCAPDVSPDRIVGAMVDAATAGVELCVGQMEEERIAAEFDARLSSYLAMIDGKTAALFRAACRIGSTLGGGSEQQTDLLGRYGTLIGLAFQVRDDLLPYLSDSGTTGKPAESDLANGRLTIPVLVCREYASPDTTAELDAILTSKGELSERFARLRTLLEETGALERAADLARGYAHEALELIDRVVATGAGGAPESAVVLRHIAREIVERTH